MKITVCEFRDHCMSVGYFPRRQDYLSHSDEIKAGDQRGSDAYVGTVSSNRNPKGIYVVHCAFGRRKDYILRKGIHIHEAVHASDRLSRWIRRYGLYGEFYRGIKLEEIRAELTVAFVKFYELVLSGEKDVRVYGMPFVNAYRYFDNLSENVLDGAGG